MNKTQLIHEIAQRSAIRKETVRTLLNTYADLVSESLVRGESVVIPGFGIYAVMTKPARTIHHVLTRKVITVPRHRAATFRSSSTLKRKSFMKSCLPICNSTWPSSCANSTLC